MIGYKYIYGQIFVPPSYPCWNMKEKMSFGDFKILRGHQERDVELDTPEFSSI